VTDTSRHASGAVPPPLCGVRIAATEQMRALPYATQLGEGERRALRQQGIIC
jgi:hypothetical protein